MRLYHQACVYILLFVSQHADAAGSKVNLGTSGSSFFAGITKFLQDITNFLGGPGVLFVGFASLCGAVFLFIAAPKQAGAAIGWLLRVIAGCIIILNGALAITYFQGIA